VLERLPNFRLPPVDKSHESHRSHETNATNETNTPDPELDAPPPTNAGRAILAVFGAAFGVMFLLLAFPDSLSGLFAVPSLRPEMAGKGAIIRSLFAVSILAVPFLLSFFPLYAALRGVKVYEQFTEGAKEAFGVAQRIIPFLVAMLVAIRMLREAGVIDLLTKTLTPVLSAIHFPAELLPMVLMRPLSGSATQGLFVELINRVGPDTLISRIAGTIYGSTETTFYVLAVYFGSVSIRQTRHAIAAGLIADTVAVIASTVICTLLFSAT
jgi:spore maturation protein B